VARYSVCLYGGQVIDPASGLSGSYDVAFDGDRVAAIDPAVDRSEVREAVDVSGCLVVPGLVDLHSHVFDGIGDGANVDEHCLRRGTTTTIDGGSSGARTFRAFRRVIEANRCRTLVWLNLSSIGQVDLRVGELLMAPWVDVDAAVRTAEANRDLIIGFKARLSTYVCGGSCLPVLRAVREAGERTGLPVMVHIGDSGEPLPELLPLPRPGDVVTHTLTGRKNGILGPDGKILPEVFAARERGVLFDAARGRNHVSFPILDAANGQGFVPDSLATDITTGTAVDPAFGMPFVMTYLLAHKLPVGDIVARATLNPARAARQEQLGRIEVGGIGDATVLRTVVEPHTIRDVDGRTQDVDRRFVAVGVVRGGAYVPAS
jgi:dihydroorotase